MPVLVYSPRDTGSIEGSHCTPHFVYMIAQTAPPDFVSIYLVLLCLFPGSWPRLAFPLTVY